MARDYSKYSKEELVTHICELEKQLKNTKYGLYWDKSIEQERVIAECKQNIPILIRDYDKSFCIDSSDNTQILIEGDNFHALTALNMLSDGKGFVDVVYIDPPYNTGNQDFAYNDAFVDVEDGYRHSKWLSFMDSRLKLARSIMTDDGVIFISIDDNEYANLKILCDSIFGQRNFITTFHWEKTQHFGRQKINSYSNCEYVLCYAKQLIQAGIKELLVEKINSSLQDAPLYNASNNVKSLVFPKGSVVFNIRDGVYTETTSDDYELLEPVTVKNGKNANNLHLRFKSRWAQDTIDTEHGKGTYFWVKSSKFAIRTVYHEGKSSKSSPKSLLFTNINNPMVTTSRFGKKVGVNENASAELEKVIGQNPFSYPKPVSLISYLISLYYDYKSEEFPKDICVLDFFAGSGTTGQAVLELNREDDGKRRCILCTNNEGNICTDVTYPRIKTVITGMQEDGTRYDDCIPSNLIYYKTGFIADSKNTDQAKYNLVEKVDELLCITEDVFVKVNRNDYFSHYKNYNSSKHMFIYFDNYNAEQYKLLQDAIASAAGTEKILYVYSNDNNVDAIIYANLQGVTVKPIPAKIYEIYKEVVEDIKRGE